VSLLSQGGAGAGVLREWRLMDGKGARGRRRFRFWWRATESLNAQPPYLLTDSHILQGAELGLRGYGVALAALVFVRLTSDQGQDVRFPVL